MKEQLEDTDRVFKTRRISYKIVKKLEGSHKINRSSAKVMKKQFDKKRKNPQELKVGNNM